MMDYNVLTSVVFISRSWTDQYQKSFCLSKAFLSVFFFGFSFWYLEILACLLAWCVVCFLSYLVWSHFLFHPVKLVKKSFFCCSVSLSRLSPHPCPLSHPFPHSSARIQTNAPRCHLSISMDRSLFFGLNLPLHSPVLSSLRSPPLSSSCPPLVGVYFWLR